MIVAGIGIMAVSFGSNIVQMSVPVQDYDIFVDGGIIQSKGESTIIEIVNDEIKILREGSLTKEEILQV